MRINAPREILIYFGVAVCAASCGSMKRHVEIVGINKSETTAKRVFPILPSCDTANLVESYERPEGDFVYKKQPNKNIPNEIIIRLLDSAYSTPSSQGPFFCDLGSIVINNKEGNAIYIVDFELYESTFNVYSAQTIEGTSETGQVTKTYKDIARLGSFQNQTVGLMFLDFLRKEDPSKIDAITSFLQRMHRSPVIEDYLTGRQRVD
jgi:hypothetical protein